MIVQTDGGCWKRRQQQEKHVCFMITAKTTYVWKMDFLNDDLSPSRLMFGYVFACSVRDRYIWAALFDVLVNTQVLRFPQRDH